MPVSLPSWMLSVHEAVPDPLELLELDALELAAPLELAATLELLEELAAAGPPDVLLAVGVPVCPPAPEEAGVLPPPAPPPLPVDASFDVWPASHDTA